MESEARRQANAALTRIILKSVAEGEKQYPQFQTHWTRHRRTMETTPMSQWTSKLSDEKLMRMLSNPEKIFDRWLTLSGLSSGKPGNVKTKFDEALLAKNRQSYAEEIHHVLELYEQEGLVPKGASRQWFAKFNETKEFLEFGGGSSPDSTVGLVKGEHVGFANPDKKGPLTISQLASAHGGSTTESAGEGFFSPEERPELRAVEQQFDTDRRRAGLTHLVDNPNSLTNRLRDVTQQVEDKHQKLFKDAKGRAKLDKLYPDLNPGTLWEIANTPGTNVLDRPATPEEIATFEAAKGGGIAETQANQAQKQRLTDELGGVVDGKPAPITSKYNMGLAGLPRGAVKGALLGTALIAPGAVTLPLSVKAAEQSEKEAQQDPTLINKGIALADKVSVAGDTLDTAGATMAATGIGALPGAALMAIGGGISNLAGGISFGLDGINGWERSLEKLKERTGNDNPSLFGL